MFQQSKCRNTNTDAAYMLASSRESHTGKLYNKFDASQALKVAVFFSI